MNLQERTYYKICLIAVLKSKKTKDNKYLRDFKLTPEFFSECIHAYEKSKLITNLNISFHYPK